MINKKRLIRLTQTLIKINSENPPGNEKRIADFAAKEMRSLGLQVKTYTFAKNRPNVIAVLKGTAPRSRARKRALLLSPHCDTVPAGKGWRNPPFKAQIKNGRIYGRGASDDKGNLACSLEVMCSLRENNVRLQHDLILAVTVDEETGSHYGIIPLLKKKILKSGAALILDSDEFDAIIAQKGLIHFRVHIFGKKAHGAYNWRGVNAIEAAARCIERLKKHRFRYRPHRLLREPTVNIGTVSGGDKVNMVADYCEFSVDVRFLPGMDHRDIIRQIKALIKKEAKRFSVTIDDVQHPYEIAATHPFVKTYVGTARRMKITATLKGSEGATVMTFFRRTGIPAFATGFGAHGTAHTTDEYARISSLYNGARLLEQFVQTYDAL